MNEAEVTQILAIIGATYQNFKPADKTSTIAAWQFFLEDFQYKDIALALKTYVRTAGNGFPPSVDQLIRLTHKAEDLVELTEGQAWSLVSQAISRSGYYSEEEYTKLPKAVQEAVGSASQLKSWSQTDLATIQTVIASNFQRSYRAVLARNREVSLAPKELTANIAIGIEGGK